MDIRSDVVGILRRNWGWFLAVGIVSIILGIVAISVPIASSLAIEMLIGGVFVVGGIFKLIHAIKSIKAGGWFWELMASLLYIAAGILLLFFPLEGLITLTALLAAFFLVSGIFRIITSIQLRHIAPLVWMLMSGIIALALGIVLWAELPGDAAWALGLLVGIDLIFSGWVMLIFSHKIKKLP